MVSRRVALATIVAMLAGCEERPPLQPMNVGDGETTASAEDRRELFLTLDRAEAAEFRAFRASSKKGSALESLAQAGDVELVRTREVDLPELVEFMHERYLKCAGFFTHSTLEAARAAMSEEATLSKKTLAPVAYTLDNAAAVQAMLPRLEEPSIRSTIEMLSAFHTRYYRTQTGADAAQALKTLWEGFAPGRSDFSVQLFTHPGWIQPSVIGTLQGAELPGEVVVIGGHLDSIHLNSPTNGRAPGSDDDASGVASLTESLRAALQSGFRPKRSIHFIAYAAEEVGLRGSQEIVQRYKANGVNVVGVLQLDMTNFKGPSTDIAIVTDRTNADQNAFLHSLIDAYLPGVAHTNIQCGYGCSDHASWNREGFAASIPFEAVMRESNQAIHTPEDTLARSNGQAVHAVKFAQLATAYLAELAKGALPGGNQAPIAQAGRDLTGAPGAVIRLDGSGSNDPDRGPQALTFRWSQLDGPSAALENAETVVAQVTPSTEGTYVFRLTVSDGAATATDEVSLTVSSGGGGPQLAQFDPQLRAPACAAVGSACDSGPTLLSGRGTVGPEQNASNTVGGSCADGNSGRFHSDESIDQLKVSSEDGGPLTPGKTARIDATVWAYRTFSADSLDLFFAADARAPSWQWIATVKPTIAGAQTLSATFTLPDGAQQAVRAQLRYRGTQSPCSGGGYDDHDDLVFPTGPRAPVAPAHSNLGHPTWPGPTPGRVSRSRAPGTGTPHGGVALSARVRRTHVPGAR